MPALNAVKRLSPYTAPFVTPASPTIFGVKYGEPLVLPLNE
ncbi:hypothetical protein [Patiriisocius sp. Uisw_017]|jgi:hypothetical protein